MMILSKVRVQVFGLVFVVLKTHLECSHLLEICKFKRSFGDKYLKDVVQYKCNSFFEEVVHQTRHELLGDVDVSQRQHRRRPCDAVHLI